MTAMAPATRNTAHHGSALVNVSCAIYFFFARDSKYREISWLYASGTRSLPPALKRSFDSVRDKRSEIEASYFSSALSRLRRSDSQSDRSCLNACVPGAERLNSCCSGVAPP